MFTSLLVGRTTLLIRCGDLLLDRGHVIHGVISDDEQVAAWADRHGVPRHPMAADLVAVMGAHRPDYLFSVVNDRVLRPDVLALPRKGAINYHDGPLPRYAGMHVTSWAIMQGEREHGITWHSMAGEVDAGEILKQKRVDVVEGDTALSLNAKCYEAATAGFAELVDELDHGTVDPHPQDLTARTYFGRYRRPPAAGVLSWHRPASEIAASVRALDFGPYANPLGRPKVAIHGDFLVCSSVEIVDVAPRAAPGTVTATADGRLVVAALERQILVRQLLTLDGESLLADDVVRRYGLHPGDHLDEVDAVWLERVSVLDADAARREPYWVRRLQELEPPVIPYVHEPAPRPAALPADWGRRDVSIPPAFLALLEMRHASRFPADGIVAAFAAYLSRLSGQTVFDVGFSTPSLSVEVAGVEALVAAQLPCRVELDLRAPFESAYVAVGDALARARRNGPFVRDIGLRYPELRAARAAHGAGAPRADALPVAVAIVRDVDAYVARDGGRVSLVVQRDVSRCALVFDRRALADADAERMAGHLTTLLAGIASQPAGPLECAPLLTAAERHQQLIEWNATEAEYARGATVHDLIRAQALRTPDAHAVEFDGARLSYGELLARGEALAERLRGLGVGSDVLVGLCAERSPELVVGLLGVLLAGGAYVPIDASYPAERMRFMLSDAGVRVLLTQRALLSRLPEHGASVVLLDDAATPATTGGPPADVVAREGAGAAAGVTPATASSLAYVIYTSGSTGQPKGVMVEHRGVVNYLTWCIDAYGLSEGLGAPVHSPTTFDLTVTSLLAPLAAGGMVVLARESLGADALAEVLRAHDDFALVKLTPSHLDLLQHQIPAAEAAGRTRCFVVGGEALHGSSVAFWARHAPGTRIVNEYGPTETVVGCCVHEATAEDVAVPDVPIGRPIANTRLYVLDAEMQVVPVGVPGELFIGGEGVARGYLNRPNLTAERFVRDLFVADPHSRLYRTGDRVRYRDDGRLEFLGRLDGQVKLRGYRVELGEVEAALAAHPAVAAAAAITRVVAPGDTRLVGYHALRSGATVIEADLRAFVEARLPSYMVPSAFVLLDAIPLTTNGKVDRTRLPAPSLPQTAHATTPPRTAIERALVGIWAEVLGLPAEAVGVTSNFFDLGGHSLLAVRMIAQVEQLLGRRPSLGAMLTHPTIERLVAELGGPASASDAPIVKVRDGSAGATPLFFFHGAMSGGGFYCHYLVRELDPDQPAYLVRPYQPGGPETIEAMAAAILPAIRAARPTGPYHLGGMCNGGSVAFEVARLLRAEGERVGVLALVNTTDRNAGLHALRRATNLVARLARLPVSRELELYRSVRAYGSRLRRLLPQANEDARPRDRLALALRAGGVIAGKVLARASRALAAVAGTRAPSPATSPPTTFTMASNDDDAFDEQRWTYISRATESYAPQPYDGPVSVVFWERSDALADSDELHAGDLTRGWRRVSREVRVAVIPGDHKDVYTRDAAALGRLLRDLMRAERLPADGVAGDASGRSP